MNKQEQRSVQTRNQLLESAAICFAESGYAATSVAKICRSAGVSKGAFYHHFASKQELFLALIEQWLAGLDRHLESLENQPQDAADRLLAMTQIVGQIIQLPDQQLLIYLEFLNQAVRDPQVWQATIAPLRLYKERIAGLIDVGIADGSFADVNSETVSSLVVGLAMGLMIQGLLEPTGVNWQAAAQEGMALILTGIRKDS